MKTKTIILAGILVCAIAAVAYGAGKSTTPATYNVSIKNTTKLNGERIMAFDIALKAGSVYSLPMVPIGWGFVIDNDPSWQTSVSGNISAGAAAVEAGFFKDFVVVQKEPSNESAFDIKVVVKTSTKGNLDKERTVVFYKKDLDIKRVLR